MLPRLTVRSTWFRALRPPNCISTSLATSRSPPSSSLPLPLDGPGPDRTASSRGVCRPPVCERRALGGPRLATKTTSTALGGGGLGWGCVGGGGGGKAVAAHKTDDAVLQVIDDEQNHQAEDGQAPIGDRLYPQRKPHHPHPPPHPN